MPAISEQGTELELELELELEVDLCLSTAKPAVQY